MNFTTKIVGVVLAAAATCGLGTATASAATHDADVPNAATQSAASSAPVHASARLGSQGYYGLDLENNTRSPLVIYTYQGSDWAPQAGNSPIGTVIPQGQHASLILRDHASAVDAVGISDTDRTLNLGMAIIQNQVGGGTEKVLDDSTFNVHEEPSGNGYSIVHITNQ